MSPTYSRPNTGIGRDPRGPSRRPDLPVAPALQQRDERRVPAPVQGRRLDHAGERDAARHGVGVHALDDHLRHERSAVQRAVDEHEVARRPPRATVRPTAPHSAHSRRASTGRGSSGSRSGSAPQSSVSVARASRVHLLGGDGPHDELRPLDVDRRAARRTARGRPGTPATWNDRPSATTHEPPSIAHTVPARPARPARARRRPGDRGRRAPRRARADPRARGSRTPAARGGPTTNEAASSSSARSTRSRLSTRAPPSSRSVPDASDAPSQASGPGRLASAEPVVQAPTSHSGPFPPSGGLRPRRPEPIRAVTPNDDARRRRPGSLERGPR